MRVFEQMAHLNDVEQFRLDVGYLKRDMGYMHTLEPEAARHLRTYFFMMVESKQVREVPPFERLDGYRNGKSWCMLVMCVFFVYSFSFLISVQTSEWVHKCFKAYIQMLGDLLIDMYVDGDHATATAEAILAKMEEAVKMPLQYRN